MFKVAHQTLFYGFVRGGPMGLRLLIFFVGAALLDAPALTALGVLHASLDLGKVITDLGIDTFAIKRFSKRPLAYRYLWKTMSIIKLLAFLFSSAILLNIFWPSLKDLGLPDGVVIVSCAYLANLFYGLSGIVIAKEQAEAQVHRLFPRVLLCYGLGSVAMLVVLAGEFSLWLGYLALAAAELALLIANWWDVAKSSEMASRTSLRALRLITWATLPLALTMVIGITYQRVDFFAVRAQLSVDEAATYALFQRLNEPALFILSAVSVTLFARFSNVQEDAQVIMRRIRILAPLGLFSGLAFSSMCFFVAYVMGVDAIANHPSLWMVMALGMGIKGSVIVALVTLVQSQFSFWIITFASALVLTAQVALVAILLPEYGMEGAAFAQAACDALNFLFQLSSVFVAARRRKLNGLDKAKRP